MYKIIGNKFPYLTSDLKFRNFSLGPGNRPPQTWPHFRHFSTIIEKNSPEKCGNDPKFFAVARCRPGITERNAWLILGGARSGFGVAGPPKWPKNHPLCAQCSLSYISLIFRLIGTIFSLHVRSHSALQHFRKKISISTSGFGSVPKDHNLPPLKFSQPIEGRWSPNYQCM